jgi:hypothetical protein
MLSNAFEFAMFMRSLHIYSLNPPRLQVVRDNLGHPGLVARSNQLHGSAATPRTCPDENSASRPVSDLAVALRNLEGRRPTGQALLRLLKSACHPLSKVRVARRDRLGPKQVSSFIGDRSPSGSGQRDEFETPETCFTAPLAEIRSRVVECVTELDQHVERHE